MESRCESRRACTRTGEREGRVRRARFAGPQNMEGVGTNQDGLRPTQAGKGRGREEPAGRRPTERDQEPTGRRRAGRSTVRDAPGNGSPATREGRRGGRARARCAARSEGNFSGPGATLSLARPRTGAGGGGGGGGWRTGDREPWSQSCTWAQHAAAGPGARGGIERDRGLGRGSTNFWSKPGGSSLQPAGANTSWMAPWSRTPLAPRTDRDGDADTRRGNGARRRSRQGECAERRTTSRRRLEGGPRCGGTIRGDSTSR